MRHASGKHVVNLPVPSLLRWSNHSFVGHKILYQIPPRGKTIVSGMAGVNKKVLASLLHFRQLAALRTGRRPAGEADLEKSDNQHIMKA